MSLKQGKFGTKLYEILAPYLKISKDEKERKAVGERIKASLFGKKVPKKYRVTTVLDPKDNFLSEVTYNYFEVFESLSRLEMISLLIRQYPKLPSWKKAGITETKYLRYHYENFLSEVYLFQERVVLMLRDLKRRCQKQNLNDEVKKIQKLEKWLKESLAQISFVRGRHTHVRRYKDSKIEQLEDLELFSSDKYLKLLKRIEYRDLRKKLSSKITEIQGQLDKVLNQILDNIIVITFETLLKKYK